MAIMGEGNMKDQLDLTGDSEIDSMLVACVKTLDTKGKEYTVSSLDRLANFRSVGADVNEPMEKVWYTFFSKHQRALTNYIKNGCRIVSNEPISGRIMDMIVYLLLFHKMSQEIERKRVQDVQKDSMGPTPLEPGSSPFPTTERHFLGCDCRKCQ